MKLSFPLSTLLPARIRLSNSQLPLTIHFELLPSNLWFGFLFYACSKLQQIAYTTRWLWVNILENTQNENELPAALAGTRSQAQFLVVLPFFLSFLF